MSADLRQGCTNISTNAQPRALRATLPTVVAFYEGALAVFARHPRVERYAWYPWATNCGLVDSAGALTPLGEAYAAAPACR